MTADFAEFEAIKQRHKTVAASRFRLVPFDQIARPGGSLYLIKGLIPREGLVVVWGPPKCGKTFLITDLALHVALGRQYRGRRTRPGRVVYLAAEGELGLSMRAEAFRRHHMRAEDRADFFLLATRTDLAADAGQLITEIREQTDDAGCAVIVIDTLNRTLNGSESSDEDMGAYIRGADTIREAFGCAVIIIHHCGIDDKRPRGHTSLAGAADAQIAVRRSPDDTIIATVEFMKDGEAGAEFCSRLRVVELDPDEDDEPITSCVIEPVDGVAPSARKRLPISGAAKIALDLLTKAINVAGETPPASNHSPANVVAVKAEVWRQYCYTGAISETDKPDAKQKAFKRAADRLQAAGAIATWDGWVWLVR